MILPILGVRFNEKIGDQHSFVNVDDVRNPNDLEHQKMVETDVGIEYFTN